MSPKVNLEPILFDSCSDVAELINAAVSNGVVATTGDDLGEFGRVYLAPAGYVPHVLDTRHLSDPTTGTHISGHAQLTIRPTAQAIRWGTALDRLHDQESMLDLVVDGIGEIAEPDGATLRDLIADLHAIRTTSARAVSRRTGESTVEVSENVTLHAGPGNTVTIPERMTVIFRPFHTDAATEAIVLPITIRPTVNPAGQVMFALSCPTLADELDRVIRGYSARLHELTGIEPLWVP